MARNGTEEVRLYLENTGYSGG